jgi:hypothetical protein
MSTPSKMSVSERPWNAIKTSDHKETHQGDMSKPNDKGSVSQFAGNR